MAPEDNAPYVTVTKGVDGLYRASLITWNDQQDGYTVSRSFGPHGTRVTAEGEAVQLANTMKVEFRP